MIKLETHVHSLGGSHCAHVNDDQILEEYSKLNYNAIVLTNHYCEVCYNEYSGTTHKEKLDHYFSLIDSLTLKAEKLGIKIFWGAETRAVRSDWLYSEYMIYGLNRKFLYDNKPLFTLTQEEMFKVCDKNGFFMYQTHPFRNGVTVGEPQYLHGVEGYNGHFNHENNNDKAMEFAEKYNLKVMSGSDYHEYHQPIRGGIYIPENISTNEQLCEFLFNNQPQLIKGE